MANNLFKNVADELTDLEKETIVPLIVDVLFGKTKTNQITSKNISKYLQAYGYCTSDIRVRKLISYISGKNIRQGKEKYLTEGIIVATGKGYYVTGEVKDVDDQLDSLQDRINNMRVRIDSLRAQRQDLINKKRA